MINKIISRIISVFFVFCVALGQYSQSISQTKSFTGRYRTRNPNVKNTLEVMQLPNGKIKFHLIALWVAPYNPENVHNGELQGVLALKKVSAVYQSENCKVTIKFVRSGVVVTQDSDAGDCVFGALVTATGSYGKVDSGPPKFDF